MVLKYQSQRIIKSMKLKSAFLIFVISIFPTLTYAALKPNVECSTLEGRFKKSVDLSLKSEFVEEEGFKNKNDLLLKRLKKLMNEESKAI